MVSADVARRHGGESGPGGRGSGTVKRRKRTHGSPEEASPSGVREKEGIKRYRYRCATHRAGGVEGSSSYRHRSQNNGLEKTRIGLEIARVGTTINEPIVVDDEDDGPLTDKGGRETHQTTEHPSGSLEVVKATARSPTESPQRSQLGLPPDTTGKSRITPLRVSSEATVIILTDEEVDELLDDIRDSDIQCSASPFPRPVSLAKSPSSAASGTVTSSSPVEPSQHNERRNMTPLSVSQTGQAPPASTVNDSDEDVSSTGDAERSQHDSSSSAASEPDFEPSDSDSGDSDMEIIALNSPSRTASVHPLATPSLPPLMDRITRGDLNAIRLRAWQEEEGRSLPLTSHCLADASSVLTDSDSDDNDRDIPNAAGEFGFSGVEGIVPTSNEALIGLFAYTAVPLSPALSEGKGRRSSVIPVCPTIGEQLEHDYPGPMDNIGRTDNNGYREVLAPPLTADAEDPRAISTHHQPPSPQTPLHSSRQSVMDLIGHVTPLPDTPPLPLSPPPETPPLPLLTLSPFPDRPPSPSLPFPLEEGSEPAFARPDTPPLPPGSPPFSPTTCSIPPLPDEDALRMTTQSDMPMVISKATSDVMSPIEPPRNLRPGPLRVSGGLSAVQLWPIPPVDGTDTPRHQSGSVTAAQALLLDPASSDRSTAFRRGATDQLAANIAVRALEHALRSDRAPNPSLAERLAAERKKIVSPVLDDSPLSAGNKLAARLSGADPANLSSTNRGQTAHPLSLIALGLTRSTSGNRREALSVAETSQRSVTLAERLRMTVPPPVMAEHTTQSPKSISDLSRSADRTIAPGRTLAQRLSFSAYATQYDKLGIASESGRPTSSPGNAFLRRMQRSAHAQVGEDGSGTPYLGQRLTPAAGSPDADPSGASRASLLPMGVDRFAETPPVVGTLSLKDRLSS